MPKLKGFPDRDKHRRVSKQLLAISEIRRRFAAIIIADGLFDTEGYSHIAEQVASETGGAEYREQLNRLFRRLDKAMPGCLESPGGPDDECAQDIVTSLEIVSLNAGYLVGIAVGMQLGPHAFDGGAR